jgi:hypothetical protein
VKASSWKQVQEISERFAALNPYDREVVSGSVLTRALNDSSRLCEPERRDYTVNSPLREQTARLAAKVRRLPKTLTKPYTYKRYYEKVNAEIEEDSRTDDIRKPN